MIRAFIILFLRRKLEHSLLEINSYSAFFLWFRAYQTLPDLPEFTLSLKPDDYELPEIAEFWVGDKSQPQIQMLKEHLKDDDDDDTFEPIEDLNL